MGGVLIGPVSSEEEMPEISPLPCEHTEERPSEDRKRGLTQNQLCCHLVPEEHY